MTKKILAAAAVAAMITFSSASEKKAHWGYEGEHGPAHWGELDEHFALCFGGVNQTPIDLDNFIEADLKAIDFKYKNRGKEFLNNGHTVQVNFEPGNSITVEGKTFHLLQYHFHTPSENHIKGKSFPMEVHLVHADENNNLAVVSVMFEVGKESAALAEILKKVPEEEGDVNSLTAEILPAEILPENRHYYRFNGSLTTPPCSENVHWFVMKESVSISKEQLKVMEKVMHAPNNRPVQPANARPILQ